MAVSVRTVADELVTEAVVAEDVAAAFFPFVDNVPAMATEILRIKAELLSISAELRSLSAAFQARAYRPRIARVLGDTQLVTDSIALTTGQILQCFERLGMTPVRNDAAYRRVAREIRAAMDLRDMSLLLRLQTYRAFLIEILGRLRGTSPQANLYQLRIQVSELLALQEGPFYPQLAGPAEPAPPRRRRRRSSSRRRPSAPEPPVVEEDAGTVGNPMQWASNLFDGMHSVTPFSTAGEQSNCKGPHSDCAREGLAQLYELLVEIDFNDALMTTQFYYNPRNGQIEVLCLWSTPGSGELQSFQALNSIRLKREQNSILMYIVVLDGQRSQRIPWARLTCASYERLVLTYLLCMCLKAQGPQTYLMSEREYNIQHETQIQAYKIADDGYLHALRIFQDTMTGGIRLEASVLNGGLQGMPVWTAFVTENVGRANWARRSFGSNKIVHLDSLHPYVFSGSYQPHRTAGGMYELEFMHARDAVDFLAFAQKRITN